MDMENFEHPDIIQEFLALADELVLLEEMPLPSTIHIAMASLVMDIISHPDVFDFSEFLCLPSILKLRDTDYSWFLDQLLVFSYGTLKDYKGHQDMLPPLEPEQLHKLKQLTLVTFIESRDVVTCSELMDELDFTNSEELQDFISDTCEQLVFHIPQLRGRLEFGESLEVFLQAATIVQRDPQTGALRNEIVTQVKVPLSRCGTHYCWKSDFKPLGREIFGQLIGITTDGHLENRSWNGLLFPGMFVIYRGLLLLRPGGEPREAVTDSNSQKDYLSIDGMVERYAGLRFQHRGRDNKVMQVMYPVYVDDLRLHLQGSMSLIPSNQGITACDPNYILFLRCHPSLQSTSVRSVVSFHIRKEYKSGSSTGFNVAMQHIKMKEKWTVLLQRHFLFKGVFQYAIDHNCDYKNTPFDCHRCIRDWETHGREHLTAAECLLFTTEVFTYLVEHFFHNFYAKLLYVLICGPTSDVNLKDWLLKLQHLTQDSTAGA